MHVVSARPRPRNTLLLPLGNIAVSVAITVISKDIQSVLVNIKVHGRIRMSLCIYDFGIAHSISIILFFWANGSFTPQLQYNGTLGFAVSELVDC